MKIGYRGGTGATRTQEEVTQVLDSLIKPLLRHILVRPPSSPALHQKATMQRYLDSLLPSGSGLSAI